MPKFQFAHLQTFARTTSKIGTQKASRWNVSDILAEAGRDEAHSRHVEHAKPPTVVYGCQLDAIEPEIERRAAESKDARGHGIRKDARVMAAFVASWPEQTPTDRAKFDAWIHDNIEFARAEFGADNVVSAVLHEDEDFPHLHVFAIPPAGPGGVFNARRLHPGETAKAGADKGKETEAYKAAMVEFQDRYFKRVSEKHGLQRVGPRRQRNDRETAVIEQQRRRAEEADEVARKKLAAAEAEALALLSSAQAEAAKKLAAAEEEKAAAVAALEEAERVAADKRDAAEQERKDAVNEANEIRVAARIEAIEEFKKKAQTGFEAGKKQALERFSGVNWLRGQIQEMTGKADVEARADELKAKLAAAEQKVVKRETEIEGLRATVKRKEELRLAAERELDSIKNPPKPAPQNQTKNDNISKPKAPRM